MAQRPINAQDFDGPFVQPLPEAARFATFAEAHYEPERRMSGSLPEQPEGLPVQAAPGNETPWRGLTSRR